MSKRMSHIVIEEKYHKAMKEYHREKKVSLRFQAEIALEAFLKKEAPDIYEEFINIPGGKKNETK